MANPRLLKRQLSEPTISRLPIYQRIAEGWERRGRSSIDSTQLGELAGVTPTTVRRDLAALGSFGQRGSGYDVAILKTRIAEALGYDQEYDVIVVGAGNLGRALVNSNNFLTRGAKLVAVYDQDPKVIGTEVAGQVVQDFQGPIAPVTVAVLCVPAAAVQSVADRLVTQGIHAFLNFAPQVISLPPGYAVHYVDFSIELQILMYHVANGTGPLGGGVLHSLGIATNSARRSVQRTLEKS
jgi:redox-sensing transcriptional repressor